MRAKSTDKYSIFNLKKFFEQTTQCHGRVECKIYFECISDIMEHSLLFNPSVSRSLEEFALCSLQCSLDGDYQGTLSECWKCYSYLKLHTTSLRLFSMDLTFLCKSHSYLRKMYFMLSVLWRCMIVEIPIKTVRVGRLVVRSRGFSGICSLRNIFM